MEINKYKSINKKIFNMLSNSGYEVHYISPSKYTQFPYVTYSYIEGEECAYSLKIELWVDNTDLIAIDEGLKDIKDLLDKKIVFDDNFSYRFYFEGPGEIMELEGTTYLGREINFIMKVI